MFKSEVKSSWRRKRIFMSKGIRSTDRLGAECRGKVVSNEVERKTEARSCWGPEVLKISEISRTVMRMLTWRDKMIGFTFKGL